MTGRTARRVSGNWMGLVTSWERAASTGWPGSTRHSSQPSSASSWNRENITSGPET